MPIRHLLGLIAAFIVAGGSAQATTIRHVSAAGSDAGRGDAAAPYRTIQHCADASAPGDTCVIAAGTYRETVTPRSGTSFVAAPSALVTVDGSDPVSNWVGDSGAIYKAAVPGARGLPADQVFVDGTMIEEARYPPQGADPMTPSWASMAKGSNRTTIVDPAMPVIDWTGATVHWWAGSDPYGQLTATVTASTAGRIAFVNPWPSRCPALCPMAGGRYYLFGTRAALSAPGQWFYDAGAGTLYLWAPGGGVPRGVTMKRRAWAFDLSGRFDVTIRGIGITAAGIRMDARSSGNLLDGLTARYVAHYTRYDDPAADYIKTGDAAYGILLQGRGNTLRDSDIRFSAGSGVVVDGTDQTVTNNLIRDIDYSGTYGAGIFILPGGSGDTITRNTITRTGRAGITISGYNADTGEHLNDSVIADNAISDHNMLSVDSGAIYVCCRVDGTGTHIDRNLVHDDRNATGDGFKSFGIFFDNSSEKFTVRGNVAWKNYGGGIKINGEAKPADDFQIDHNTISGGKDSILLVAVRFAEGTRIEANRITTPVRLTPSSPPAGIVIRDNGPATVGAPRTKAGCTISPQCVGNDAAFGQ